MMFEGIGRLTIIKIK